MKNNNIQDNMNIENLNANENKKAWMAPELEVLDGRNTYSGGDPGTCEDWACDNPGEGSLIMYLYKI